MLQLLTRVQKEVQEATHLNNHKKNEKSSQQNLGWEDTPDQAKELHQSMTIKGNTRWPPACNVNHSQTPPKGHGADLTQIRNNGNCNGKSSHNGNGHHKKPFFRKKFPKQPKASWKNEHPRKNQLEKTVDGVPVCS